MSELKELIENTNKTMDTLVNELTSHKSMLSNISTAFKDAINSTNEEIETLKSEISKLENEIKILNENIDERNKSISNNKNAIADITSQLNQQENKISELNSKISEYTSKLEELQNKNSVSEVKKTELEADLKNKQNAKEDLLKSIDEKVQVNNKELEHEKQELAKVMEENQIWEYLYGKMEAPEIEILAIIASHRGIALDEIKKLAKTTQAVFVSRALSKLEADGKITLLQDDKWDLSPELLSAVN